MISQNQRKVIFLLISISIFFYGITLFTNKKIFKKKINVKTISSILEQKINNHEKILITDDRYYFYFKPNKKIMLFPQHNLYDFAPQKINLEEILNNKKILWIFSKKLNFSIVSQNNSKIYKFSTINKKYEVEIINNKEIYEDNNTIIISGRIFKIRHHFTK